MFGAGGHACGEHRNLLDLGRQVRVEARELFPERLDAFQIEYIGQEIQKQGSADQEQQESPKQPRPAGSTEKSGHRVYHEADHEELDKVTPDQPADGIPDSFNNFHGASDSIIDYQVAIINL
jgi:hypothetical protein